MNNFFRFLIALFASPIVFVLMFVIAALFVPALIFIQILIATIITIFVIVGFFALLYYVSRKEPKVTKTRHSSNYSIESGKAK